MIEWLARRIFGWTTLRKHIVDEVHLYDYISSVLQDPKSSEVGASFYPDFDGIRGWSKDQSLGRYYFNDIPEKTMMSALFELEKMESHE
jgi:hypothetical protein